MPKPKVRDQILALLEQNKGNPLSGEDLARQLSVTRAAVWKAVAALREDGCNIKGTTHKGYTLLPDSDLLTAAAVSSCLKTSTLPWKIQAVSRIGSTNTALREQAQQGAEEGTVLVAAEQTAGRGRMGRSFYSPAGTGVYFSVLLRPQLAAQDAVLLTAAAAVAAAQAAQALGCAPLQIKWVNDLLLDGKKVCGILTEAALDVESGCLEYAILGIGYNLAPPADGWPEPLRGAAGTLWETMPPAGTRAKLAAAFLDAFGGLYQNLPRLDFLEEYRKRQLLIGQTVEIFPVRAEAGASPRLAVAVGIDDRCRLLVRYKNGRQDALSGGEVRIRTRAGGQYLPESEK